MIINSESVQLIRLNAFRLAQAIRSKEDLAELSTAGSFEQVFGAIEGLLTSTDMYFDDEILSLLDDSSWKSFKATLLVYTLNLVNRFQSTQADAYPMASQRFQGEVTGDRTLAGASSLG